MVLMNLTEKEIKIMNIIKETMDSYGDGFTDVMIEDLIAETGYKVNTVKGVLGSLDKKNLIFFMDVNREYNVYGLTRNGFKALGIDVDYL
jgi:DNA-binding MarR family transcriptional regulator